MNLQNLICNAPIGMAAWIMAIMIVLLPACSVPGGSGDRPVQLRLSTWGSAQEMAVIREIVSDFEAKYPDMAVEILHIPQNYYQKLHILIAGGLTPDVMFTNSISFPVYAVHGIFAPLDDPIARSNAISRQDFYPNALKAFTWHDETGKPSLQVIPRDISNLVVYYNEDLFRKAGVAVPQAGWTWADLVEKGRALTHDLDGDGRVDQFGMSFYDKPPLYWMPFVWSAGGWMFSPDYRQLVLGSPEALSGLRYYADLRNRYHVAPRLEESGGMTMAQLFLQQRIAMMVSGRWNVPLLREQAGFGWDVAPLPIGPSGESRVGIDASGYAVSADTPYPKAAFALVEHLTSRESIEKVARSGLIVPARKDVAESPVFLSPNRQPTHSRVFLDVIEFGVPTRTPPRWNEISEVILLALEPVWNGRQTPAEAIKPIAPKVNELLEVGQ